MKCGEMLTKTLVNDCHVVMKHTSVVKVITSPVSQLEWLVYIFILFVISEETVIQ